MPGIFEKSGIGGGFMPLPGSSGGGSAVAGIFEKSGIGGGFMPLPGSAGADSFLAAAGGAVGTGGAFPNVPTGGGAVWETGGATGAAGAEGAAGAGTVIWPGSGTGLRVPVEARPGRGGTSWVGVVVVSFSSGLFAASSQISSPSCDTASRPSEPQASAEERSRL